MYVCVYVCFYVYGVYSREFQTPEGLLGRLIGGDGFWGFHLPLSVIAPHLPRQGPHSRLKTTRDGVEASRKSHAR